jgi:hypothetical protein
VFKKLVDDNIKTSHGSFIKAPWYHRFWWRLRPYSVTKAKTARVASDVEADVRNWTQFSRTWVYATAISVVVSAIDHFWNDKAWGVTSFITMLGIVAAQVSGLTAMRRSNESRSYIGHLQETLQSLTTRSVFASVIAYEKQLACATSDDVAKCARATLEVLKHSRRFPNVDAFSLWARDDANRRWRMVTAIGIDPEVVENFSQELLSQETPGAGIVANLAVTALPRYYQRRQSDAVIGDAEWFAANERSSRTATTLGVFMLASEKGEPVGAFALTSDVEDALEHDASAGGFPRPVMLILDECTVSLVGLATRATELWGAK